MPQYINEVFMKAPKPNLSLRNSYYKLKLLFHKTSTGQNAVSFIGPVLYNIITENIKRTTELNTFKHNVRT